MNQCCQQLFEPVAKKPAINYNCTDYTLIDMVNLNVGSILSEPPFTHNISYEYVVEYSDCDVPPMLDPKILSLIEGTEEKYLQLLTNVA